MARNFFKLNEGGQTALAIALCLLLSLGLIALEPPDARGGRILNDSLVTRPFAHHVFQDVLNRFVDTDGNVAWIQLRARPKRLNQYLEQLAAVSPDSQPDYFPDGNDAAAYWINAHNAVAMRIVLDHYPIDNLDRLPEMDRIDRYVIGKRHMTLAELREKAMTAGKPGVLFALSDFSLAAPPLGNQVYEGKTLISQLQQAQRVTLSDPGLIGFRKEGRCTELKLSPYFRGFEPALLAHDPGEDEDRDQIVEEETPPKLFSWVDVIRPFAPPDYYAGLGGACQPRVQFVSGDRRLRETAP